MVPEFSFIILIRELVKDVAGYTVKSNELVSVVEIPSLEKSIVAVKNPEAPNVIPALDPHFVVMKTSW